MAISTLVVDLVANTASFVRSLDQSRTASTAFGVAAGAAMSSVVSGLVDIGVRAGTAIPRLIENSIDAADNLAKMSQKVGISVEALSSLGHAANLSGISINDIQTSIGRLSRAASDANNGLATSERAFNMLGISVTDSSGKLRSTEDLLLDVADKFAAMEDGTQKTALAMELFGRSGLNLIPMLNQGSAGLLKMKIEAQQLGLELSTGTAQASEEFNDNLTRLSGAVSGLGNQLAEQMLPTLVLITEKFVNWVKESDFVRISIILISTAFQTLVEVVTRVAGVVESISASMSGSFKAVALAAKGDFGGALDALREGGERSRQAMIDTTASVNQLHATFGRTASDMRSSSRTMTSGLEDVAEVSEKVRKEQEKLAKEVDKLRREFDDSLRPAEQLERKLETLRRTGASAEDILKVYGNEIARVSSEQNRMGQSLPPIIRELENMRMTSQFAAGAQNTLWQSILDVNSGAAQQRLTLSNLTNTGILYTEGLKATIQQQNAIDQAVMDSTQAQQDYFDSLKASDNQMAAIANSTLPAITENTETFASVLKSQVSTALTDTARGLADAIVKWESFGETGKRIVQELATGIVQVLIEGALTKLLGVLDDVIGKIPGLNAIFGGGGGVVGAVGGTVGGVGGGAGGVGGSLGGLAGAANPINMATGIISAGAGIVSAIGTVRLEGSLNAIALHTLETKNVVLDHFIWAQHDTEIFWGIRNALVNDIAVSTNESAWQLDQIRQSLTNMDSQGEINLNVDLNLQTLDAEGYDRVSQKIAQTLIDYLSLNAFGFRDNFRHGLGI